MCDNCYEASTVNRLSTEVASLWKIVRLLSAHVCETGTPIHKEGCEVCLGCEHQELQEYDYPCFNCVKYSKFTEKKPPPSKSEYLDRMLKLIDHKEKLNNGKS